jgi:molecular chaperone Hsp33
MSTNTTADICLRAMTVEDGFRAMAVRSTDTVERAIDTQRVRGPAAHLYAELITGAVLLRQTMAPRMRVQAMLKHVESGSMVADSHPDGMTRGLVNLRSETRLQLGPDTQLRVVRELPNGELHQGVVATNSLHGLSASLTTYMARSEQVETVVGVGCTFDGARIVHAGGYIIQHMPKADLDVLAALTARLEQLPGCDTILEQAEGRPEGILEHVLDGIDFDVLQHDDVRFGCNCSRERFVSSLATLGRQDLEALTENDEPLDITCDYCAEEYRISTTRIRTLLEAI